MIITTIFNWYRKLEREIFNKENAKRLRMYGTEEKVINGRKVLDEDKRVTYRQIEESFGLNASAIT